MMTKLGKIGFMLGKFFLVYVLLTYIILFVLFFVLAMMDVCFDSDEFEFNFHMSENDIPVESNANFYEILDHLSEVNDPSSGDGFPDVRVTHNGVSSGNNGTYHDGPELRSRYSPDASDMSSSGDRNPDDNLSETSEKSLEDWLGKANDQFDKINSKISDVERKVSTLEEAKSRGERVTYGSTERVDRKIDSIWNEIHISNAMVEIIEERVGTDDPEFRSCQVKDQQCEAKVKDLEKRLEEVKKN